MKHIKLAVTEHFNTMRPRQNGRRFADDTFKRDGAKVVPCGLITFDHTHQHITGNVEGECASAQVGSNPFQLGKHLTNSTQN